MDQTLSFGDYIFFRHDNDNQITGFEKSINRQDTVYSDSKNLFVSLCVFNVDLTEVYTEHFGTIKLTKENLAVCILKLSLINHVLGLKRCSNSNVAIDRQMSTTLLDNPVNGGQAQSGSLARPFGGEEWFEDP